MLTNLALHAHKMSDLLMQNLDILCGLRIWLPQITPPRIGPCRGEHGNFCSHKNWLNHQPSSNQNFLWRTYTFWVDFRFGYLKSPSPRIGPSHGELCRDLDSKPEGYSLVDIVPSQLKHFTCIVDDIRQLLDNILYAQYLPRVR